MYLTTERKAGFSVLSVIFLILASAERASAFLGAGSRLLGASTATAPGGTIDVAGIHSSSWRLGATDDDKSDEKSVVKATDAAVQNTPTPAAAAPVGSGTEADVSDLTSRLLAEAQEVGTCASLLFEYVTKSDTDVTAEDIVSLCDDLDNVRSAAAVDDDEANQDLLATRIDLRSRTLRAARYELLNKLMRNDYAAYVATASFLSPSRIPRDDLPNVQDVPYPEQLANDEAAEAKAAAALADLKSDEGEPLVADCTLDGKVFDDSPLDKLLLGIFRDLVEKNTGGVTSPKPGIDGLLEQGRTFMLQPGQTAEAQHKMVKDTLGGLMTPVLPPFYRIFMTGIVPKLGTDWDGKQIGPWFYAPWLTSVVTPTFFGFLVGPSRPNTRKDGRPGGLVVEKCKFLQESGCKGLCLHQCKLPAQEFFKEELGLDLTVSPNFVTQECQWSFGEVPLPPKEDPSFPSGCLVGCESRKAIATSSATTAFGCT